MNCEQKLNVILNDVARIKAVTEALNRDIPPVINKIQISVDKIEEKSSDTLLTKIATFLGVE